jgi:hypothetical protein
VAREDDGNRGIDENMSLHLFVCNLPHHSSYAKSFPQVCLDIVTFRSHPLSRSRIVAR